MRKTIPAPERFWPKVRKTDSCWLWTGSIDSHGYGQFRVDSMPAMPVKAHRFAYEELCGPIPADRTLDHLCRVRICVNPDHLDVVSGMINTLRGEGPTAQNARKTHCIHGHELPPRVPGARRRRCRTCQSAADRAYKARTRSGSWLGHHPSGEASMARIPYVWVEAARLLGVCLLAGAGLGLIVSLFRRPT